MTSASHAEGRQFDPGQVYLGHWLLLLLLQAPHESAQVAEVKTGKRGAPDRAKMLERTHLSTPLALGVVPP